MGIGRRAAGVARISVTREHRRLERRRHSPWSAVPWSALFACFGGTSWGATSGRSRAWQARCLVARWSRRMGRRQVADSRREGFGDHQDALRARNRANARLFGVPRAKKPKAQRDALRRGADIARSAARGRTRCASRVFNEVHRPSAAALCLPLLFRAPRCGRPSVTRSRRGSRFLVAVGARSAREGAWSSRERRRLRSPHCERPLRPPIPRWRGAPRVARECPSR